MAHGPGGHLAVLIIVENKAVAGSVTGTVAVTLANATSAATGTETITGTVAVTLANATCVASGTVANPVTGTVAVTLANVTSVASGTSTSQGTLAVTLANVTCVASGTVANPVTGTVAVTLANATSVAAGTETITGTVAVTLAHATCAASGSAAAGVTGTVNVTLANATSATRGVADSFIHAISGRRLVDHAGKDILLRCMSSWGLAQNLSNANITTVLEGLQARHFNAVIVQMFGYEPNGNWDPYVAGNGSAVFTGTPYQSSLGAGWGSMDQVVSEAYRLGMTVIMSIYTAFGTSGPRADMEAASNGQMTTFGNSVATRYLEYENIVWHIGADDAWDSGDTIGARVDAFFEGVNTAEGATRRPVRLCEPANASSTSGYAQFTDWYGASDVALTVNSLYMYTDDSVDVSDAVHNETGATTIPWWDCEPPYRYSPHYGADEPQELRERLWTVVIRQGVGINWGNEDFWPFGKFWQYTGSRTWTQVLTDPDTYWAQYAWDTFTDVGNCAGWTRDAGGFITSGLGSGETKAASSYSTAKGLVYLPDSRSVTADLTEFSGSYAACHISKIDPTTGTKTLIHNVSTAGSQVISALGNNASGTFSDWVLLFEGANDATGTVAVTLANVTSVATGTETITGTVAVTLANATSSAAGTETITGTVAVTLANATSVATGTETITGTVNVTLGNATSVASGSSTMPGTLAVTSSKNCTSAASGIVVNPMVGTVNVTLANANSVATGTETFTGTCAVTLANVTSAAAGTVIANVTGTVNVTLQNVTCVAFEASIVGSVTVTMAHTDCRLSMASTRATLTLESQ